VIKPEDLPTKKSEDWRYLDVAALAGAYELINDKPVITRGPLGSRSGRATQMHFEKGPASQTIKPALTIKSARAIKFAQTKKPAAAETIFEIITRKAPIYTVRVDRSCRLTIVHQSPGAGQIVCSAIQIIIASPQAVTVDLDERWENKLSRGLFVGNTVIELGNSAVLKHKIDQRMVAANHIKSYSVSVGRAARYNLAISAGRGQILRTNASIDLIGARASTLVAVAQSGSGSQQLDSGIVINHAAPNTKSLQEIRTLVRDEAHGIVNGGVHVKKNAVHSSVSQFAHGLMLSPRAHCYGKPSLRIHTDKVQARHGFSIRPVDEQQLFYLQSRGQLSADAKDQLVKAFISEVLPAELQ
ncbi:MAG: SufD family Fe-S cluster assembly protein, partial [bacterium]|nr:SufD family Fe-S cluster assembly protein [bacterium]